MIRIAGREEVVATPLLGVAFFIPLTLMPMFATGFVPKASSPLIAMHSLSGLSAAVLAVAVARGRVGKGATPFAAIAVLLALCGLVPALLQQAVWPIWGTWQTGLGPLWFTILALWTLVAGAISGNRRAVETLAWAMAASGFTLLVLLIAGLVQSRVVLIDFAAYYAWPALAMLALLSGGVIALRTRLGIALLVSALMLLVVGRSVTLAMAAALVLALWAANHWLPRIMAWLSRPMPSVLLVGAACALPALAIREQTWLWFGASMKSRQWTANIVLSRLGEGDFPWLTGLGWGVTPRVFDSHMGGAGTALWDGAHWDFLLRDFVHSHNLMLEAALSGGWPAMALTVTLLAAIPLVAAPARRPAALALALAWALTGGLWFELIFALPFLGTAVALLAHDRTARPLGRAWAIVPAMGAPVLLGAALLLWQQARSENALLAWLDRPGTSAPAVRNLYGDDTTLVHLTSRIARRITDANAGTGWVDPTMTDGILPLLLARLPHSTNPSLAIIAARLFETVLLSPHPATRALLAPYAADWPIVIDRALVLAPGRTDLAIGYLTLAVQAGDFETVGRWGKRLRQVNADDPLGLYYTALPLLAKPGEADRRTGLFLMRRAVAQGLERYIPLADETRRQLQTAP